MQTGYLGSYVWADAGAAINAAPANAIPAARIITVNLPRITISWSFRPIPALNRTGLERGTGTIVSDSPRRHRARDRGRRATACSPVYRHARSLPTLAGCTLL